jgi:hypothetical protein
MLQMTSPGGGGLTGVREQFVGVLADGLEQPVSRASPRALRDRDERLVDEAREHLQGEPRGYRHRSGGIEPAHEHAQVSQRPPLLGIEELVAPRHRGPDRPVMRWGTPPACPQRVEPVLQA